jgi:hypothetical protein
MPCSCANHKLNALLLTEAVPMLRRSGAVALIAVAGTRNRNSCQDRANFMVSRLIASFAKLVQLREVKKSRAIDRSPVHRYIIRGKNI